MSLTEQNVRQRYNGNGSTTTFAIPFEFYSDNTMVKVLVLEADGETETPKTGGGVDYSVVGTNVVFVTAPLTGTKVLVYQDIDYDQDQDYSNQSTFLPSNLELGLDKLTSISQQTQEEVGRALKFRRSSNSSAELAEPTASTALVWNDDGTVIEPGPTVDAIEGAQAAGLAAVQAASDAANSASDASASASQAAVSAAAAAASATAAATSATNAASSENNAAASEAAATTSETNAAASAASASTSATNAATSATSAATSATNATNSAAAAATSATNAATSETNAAASAAAAAASAAGVQGGYTVEDSRGTPANVTALGGVVISDNTKHRIKKYVQGSGGAIDISANPQITAGQYDGQELLLVGRSATNTLQFDDGDGLALQGPCILGLNESIHLNWDTSVWVEVARSN